MSLTAAQLTDLTETVQDINSIEPSNGGLYLAASGETQGYLRQDSVTGALPTTVTPVYGQYPWPIFYYA